MKKQSWIILILLAIATTLPTFVSADDGNATVVPMEIIQQGRQAVVGYLGSRVDSLLITFDGRSLSGPVIRYVSKEELISLGYIHDGSFSELFAATAGINFQSEVLVTPEGNYDISAEIKYRGVDGRTVLLGSGYINLALDNNNGVLHGTFEPWIGIPDKIMTETARFTTAAKWIGSSWRNLPRELGLFSSWDGVTAYIEVPTSILDDGTILVSYQRDNGSNFLLGYDLTSSHVRRGEELHAHLGNLGSSDVQILTDSLLDLTSKRNAFQDEGQVYSRVPLTELVIHSSVKQVIDPQVKVWGQEGKFLIPSRITVTVITLGPTPLCPPGYTCTEEPIMAQFDLQPAKGGGWTLDLPAGTFQLQMEFPEIKDWNLNPGPKG